MKTNKAILLTCVLMVAGIGAAYAFRRRDKKTDVKKATVSAGISENTSAGTDVIKQGVDDPQHVIQLQEVLNTLHKAAKYINTNCGGIKWGYMPGTLPDGNIVNENGTFDSKMAAASQYYLYRQEVDLEYLDLIRKKIAKWKKGDKCIYPLSVSV